MKFLYRKAGHLSHDGVPKLTTGWEIEIDAKEYKISFCESTTVFHITYYDTSLYRSVLRPHEFGLTVFLILYGQHFFFNFKIVLFGINF